MSIVLSDQEYTALVDKANYVREENNYLRAEIERMKQLISDRELLLTIEGTKALEKERNALRASNDAFVKIIQNGINEISNLENKWERVRELCVSNKKHGIGVVGVDNLLEILDGEEGENE